MLPFLCRRFACLILLLASALECAAEPVNGPKSSVPTMESSLDQFIVTAKRQAETGSTELKQLVAQLDPLRAKQKALLTTRGTKEAELAQLRSAGGDTQRIATLQQEIDLCRSQLNATNAQLQVLMSRIQPGPKPLAAGMLPASGGPVPMPGGLAPTSGGPVALAAPTPGPLSHAVPSDKVKAAADALARNPAPSAAAARTAASQILSASQPGSTHGEVEQLARRIVDLARQTNAAELNAELTAGKQPNEKKSGPPVPEQASTEIKFEVRVPPSEDHQNRLQELQARQAKLEQVTIELMKKPGGVPDMMAPVKK